MKQNTIGTIVGIIVLAVGIFAIRYTLLGDICKQSGILPACIFYLPAL